MSKLESLEEELKRALVVVGDEAGLESVRVEFLGRKGKLAEAMKKLGELPVQERKRMGVELNEVKEKMEALFGAKHNSFEHKKSSMLAESEWIDVTLPGVAPAEGHLHLTTQAIMEIEQIFNRIGFTRIPVPEVDWDWYAFEGLNMPKQHPARDDWETFFVDAPEGKKGKIVAVPHVSNAQVRALETMKPPFRALYIGKAFRRQSDVSHLPIHNQFEVMMVDKDVTIVHLKGVIEHFVHEYFGYDRQVRIRPHHFRFTEPSFEIDISCGFCGGEGCRLCKEGWLELAGAGMTHPNVLKAGGVDPNEYSALAFAFGIERTYMMREGMRVGDIRVLYKNDLRFLQQF